MKVEHPQWPLLYPYLPRRPNLRQDQLPLIINQQRLLNAGASGLPVQALLVVRLRGITVLGFCEYAGGVRRSGAGRGRGEHLLARGSLQLSGRAVPPGTGAPGAVQQADL